MTTLSLGSPLVTGQFHLPVWFDIGGVFLFSLTGAWVAIRKDYDFVGVFTVALITGAGGGLIRDSVFLQEGAPALLRDERYIYAVLIAVLLGAVTFTLGRRFERLIAAVDALGLGAYAIVGVQKSLEAGLTPAAAVLVGVSNAAGGGIIRDIIVGDEPLVLKPGQFYVLAALAGCIAFFVLIKFRGMEAEQAGWYAIGAVFVIRMLSIQFNWRTGSMQQWQIPIDQWRIPGYAPRKADAQTPGEPTETERTSGKTATEADDKLQQ